MLLYFTGDGLCSLEQVVDIDLYFRGGCPTIFFFYLPLFPGVIFLPLSGEGDFLGGVFSFWSGGGAFFGAGDVFFFFFTWGGGSPFVGEKRAFMAEPSARPAINDMLFRKGGVNEVKTKKTNKK